jgi:hypothetical protein
VFIVLILERGVTTDSSSARDITPEGSNLDCSNLAPFPEEIRGKFLVGS